MGSIEKKALADGSKAWKVVWTDPSGKRRSKQFSARTGPRPAESANAFLARVHVELRQGTYVEPKAGDATFAEVAEMWRAVAEHGPGRAVTVERLLRLHINPVIGPAKIGTLRNRDLQLAMATWRNRPSDRFDRAILATGSVKLIEAVVRAVLSYAVRNELISRNPWVNVATPSYSKTRVTIPTQDQVDAVLQGVPGRVRGVVELVMGTGLRSGEVRGLDVGRVLLLERRVIVNRQLYDVRAGVCEWGPPKSSAGTREIPLSASYSEALAHHLALYPPRAGILFTNRAGVPWRRNALQEAVSPAMRRAGLPIQTGLHLFRHYYAAGLIAAGLDVRTVMTLLGHSSAKETLETYGHLWHNYDDRVRDAIELAFPARPPGGVQGDSQGARGSQGDAVGEGTRHKKPGQSVVHHLPSSG